MRYRDSIRYSGSSTSTTYFPASPSPLPRHVEPDEYFGDGGRGIFTSVKTYAITNWSEHYENNRSRIVKDLAWVKIPNKHDGEKYSRLIARKDAAQIFSAWILILQVASRCQPRGTLLRSDETAHDSDSLSIKTRAPKAWFDLALPVLTEMRWLTSQDSEPHNSCHHADSTLSPNCQDGDEEEKEQKGTEERPIRSAAADPADDEEWLQTLIATPAYQSLDIRREFSKMSTWCETNNRQPTRRRFVNWINRCERPMHHNGVIAPDNYREAK